MSKKKSGESKVRLPADKRDDFTRLANARTNKAIHAIGQLQHLANPHQYEYSSEEAQKIVDALNAAVLAVSEKFTNPSSKVGGFKL